MVLHCFHGVIKVVSTLKTPGCTYTYFGTCIYIYMHIHIYSYIHMYTCIYSYLYTILRTWCCIVWTVLSTSHRPFKYQVLYIHICMYMYIHICIYVYTYIHIYTYIYIYQHTNLRTWCILCGFCYKDCIVP